MEASEVARLPASAGSGGADGNRLGDPEHAVEHRDRDDGLALLGRQAAGAQLRSDAALVAPDRGFGVAAPAIAGRLLPGHAALLRDELDGAIALALRVGVLRARHRRRARWDDDV